MRKFVLRKLVFAAMILVGINVYAHDFVVEGIYYNFLDKIQKTVAVTFEGQYSLYFEEYSGDIVIPATVEYEGVTYTVTEVNEAFNGCENVKSVSLPNTIKTIGGCAFQGCSNLTSVELQEGGFLTIGESAFKDCQSLTEINLPLKTYKIGSFAFGGCVKLAKMYIPEYVYEIECGVFEGCSALESIEVSQENPFFDSRDNSNAIIVITNDELIAGCKNTIIPSTVRSVLNWAFSGHTGLTTVHIPASLTRIGEMAFCGCMLETIAVDSNNAVYDSRNQCNAIIETATNTLIQGSGSTIVPNGVEAIANYAFKSIPIANVDFPNSLKCIGEESFENCTNLTAISIPDGVVSIGYGAFMNCKNLSVVNLPVSVVSLGGDAFMNTLWMKSQPNGVLYLSDFVIGVKGKKLSGTVTIKDGVKVIAGYALYDQTEMTDIKLPSSLERIGESAFSNSGLTGVNIPENVEMGEWIFSYCDNLTDVVINEGTATIPVAAFYQCKSMKSVRLPESITTIADEAFWCCTGLAEINWPSQVKNIGNRAFGNCYNIKGITLSDVLQGIGYQAFAGCKGITEITIPESVKEIKGYSFEACEKLQTVYFNAIDCVTDDAVNTPFRRIGHPIKVVCGDKAKNINDSMFSGSDVAEIDLGEAVEKIGYCAFEACKLKEIKIPKSVTSIECHAFPFTDLERIEVDSENPVYDSRGGCNAIIETATNTLIRGCKNTIIPNSVEMLGKNSFYGAKLIKSIVIPESVDYLDCIVFAYCSSLKEIVCLNRRPPVCAYNTFGDGDGSDLTNCILKVPNGAKLTYVYAESWKPFFVAIEEFNDENVTIVQDKAVFNIPIEAETVSYRIGIYSDEIMTDLISEEEYAVSYTDNVSFNTIIVPLSDLENGVYYYNIIGLDAAGNSVSSYTGEFELEFVSGMADVVGKTPYEVARYNDRGMMVKSPVTGLNIILMSDGSVKKEIVK